MTAATSTNNLPGRPTKYDEQTASYILEQLARGRTLTNICREKGVPNASTVINWVYDNREGFSERYAACRQIGYQLMADEVMEIADDGTNDWIESNDPDNPGYRFNGEHYQRSRLRVDTRKWMLAKALPKIYGDKTQVDVQGQVHHAHAHIHAQGSQSDLMGLLTGQLELEEEGDEQPKQVESKPAESNQGGDSE